MIDCLLDTQFRRHNPYMHAHECRLLHTVKRIKKDINIPEITFHQERKDSKNLVKTIKKNDRPKFTFITWDRLVDMRTKPWVQNIKNR